MDQRRDAPGQMTTSTMERPTTEATLTGDTQGPTVGMLARRQLAERCTYAFCCNQVTFSFSRGILTLEGRPPSFYLKQVLQTLLRDLEGVTSIVSRVDVVSATGLSSVRPK